MQEVWLGLSQRDKESIYYRHIQSGVLQLQAHMYTSIHQVIVFESAWTLAEKSKYI